MNNREHDGLVDQRSHHSVDQTVSRLQAMLLEKGIKLFALIDHSGEAATVGLVMRPTKLLIFGNSKAGTPLMIASPSVAIDLPLKILVWEDETGQVWVTVNSPQYLRDRHHFPAELLKNIAAVAKLAEAAAGGVAE